MQSYAVSCGLNLSYDSYDYLHAAETFKTSFEVYNANGDIYVERAPLFPLLLSISANPYVWIIINILNSTFCLYFIYRLGQKLIQNLVLLMLFMLTQVFSVSQLMIHSFLWSEPLFLLLLLIFLHRFQQYLQSPQNTIFLKLILLAFLFALQRTPGIFFILGAGLSLWIFLPKAKIFSFKKASLFVSLASMGWFLWLGRNLSFKGIEYHPATETVFQNFSVNIYQYSNVISAWFLPLSLSFWLRIGICLGLLCVFVGLFYQSISTVLRQKFIVSLIIIFAVYTLALLSLENVGYHESERYYSLVYFPVFLIIFLFLEQVFRRISIYKQKIVAVILSLWLIYPVSRSLNNVVLWHKKSCEQSAASLPSLLHSVQP